MKNFISCITLSLAATLCAGATGRALADIQIDSTLTSNRIVFIDGKPATEQTQEYVDSIRRVISEFYYDQFRHFQDPGAPYFLFMSKGCRPRNGYRRLRTHARILRLGRSHTRSGFAPYLIPIHPSPTDMRHVGTSPAGTSLFFRVIGRNKALGDYQLYIEANFNGYETRDFRLKKAYATINNFTVGYAASTYSDPAATPPTVDAQGPNNKIGTTAVLVRYMPVIKDRWVLAVSGESPESPSMSTT